MLSEIDRHWEALLLFIVEDSAREAEWLDLLSQLEYVGCRKIIKSVPHDRVDESVLRHIAEEASHAYLLKALVPAGTGKLAPRLKEAGWRYFQSLDQAVSALQADTGDCYPAVSWAVERRVLEIYPQYADRTHDPRVRRTLRRILAQEQRHGQLFRDSSVLSPTREVAARIEAGLWSAFVNELSGIFAVPHSHTTRPLAFFAADLETQSR